MDATGDSQLTDPLFKKSPELIWKQFDRKKKEIFIARGQVVTNQKIVLITRRRTRVKDPKTDADTLRGAFWVKRDHWMSMCLGRTSSFLALLTAVKLKLKTSWKRGQ